jgi:hypothetical protein
LQPANLIGPGAGSAIDGKHSVNDLGNGEQVASGSHHI